MEVVDVVLKCHGVNISGEALGSRHPAFFFAQFGFLLTGGQGSGMSPDVARRRTRALVRVSVALVTVAAVAVSVLVFAAFGWSRMDAECRQPEVMPAGATAESVEFSWSWSPVGFTCTWPIQGSSDVSMTELWW